MGGTAIARIALIGLLWGVAAGGGARDIGQDEALRLRREGAVQSFEQLLAVVSARYPGVRVLEVELEEEDGRFIYEMEVLTADGAVREIELDARTGAVLQDELED